MDSFKNIEMTLNAVRMFWYEHPELRLGQIIYEACDSEGEADSFYIPDDKLRDILKTKFFEKY